MMASAVPGLAGRLRGTLRIKRTSSTEGVVGAQDFDGANRNASDAPSYYQKLTNLFPAEALALHGTGVALFGRANLFIVAVVLCVLVALRWFASQPPQGGRPQPMVLLVAAAAYLLWATASDPAWLFDLVRRAPAAPEIAAVQRGAAFLGAVVVLLVPLMIKPASGGS